jgi:hypothetical protein
MNKVYVVMNRSEVEKDICIISTDLVKAKSSFDNYSANWGMTVLAEVELDKDFGMDDDLLFWGGTVLYESYNEPDEDDPEDEFRFR